MNRKCNPYVSLVALLLLVLILVLTCTGCANLAKAAETKPAPRFAVERAGNGCTIITDNETGVQYLFYYYSDLSGRAGGGLTKLEE